MVLNRISAGIFKQEKTNRVDLLWDSERSKVGIQVNRNKGMYQLNFAPQLNGAVVSASTFFNYIKYDWTETRTFPAVWDDRDKILMVDIQPEHLQSTGTIRRANNSKKSKNASEESLSVDINQRSA
jgi:hypothetical protein